MNRNFFLISLLLAAMIIGCVGNPPTPEEQGLKSRSELESYFVIPKTRDVTNKYVTHFAKSNLKEGNAIVIGAVLSVNYDIPNAQRGTIQVFQTLWGDKIKKVVNVYSSEIGYLEACTGEQVFVLNGFAGGSNAKIVTNFRLDPLIREQQIRTLQEILKIEKMDNFLQRKKEFVTKCFEHANDENVWVANTWSFQLLYFCKDYPDYLEFEDLMNLKKIERNYIFNRPQDSEVLKIIKATIVVILSLKFKRVWFERILNGSKSDALKAIGFLDFWFSSTYKNAFTFDDRVVINSLIYFEDDTQIYAELLKLEQHLREILTTLN